MTIQEMAQRYDSIAEACSHAAHLVTHAQSKWPRVLLSCAFDIDDTLLYDDGAGGIKPNAPVVNLMKWCHMHGLRVHLITARPASSRAVALADLADIGCGTSFDTLQMLPDGHGVDDVALWKFVARWHMLLRDRETATRSHLVFSAGDQWWDMLGTDAMISAAETMYHDSTSSYVITRTPRMEAAMACVKLPAL